MVNKLFYGNNLTVLRESIPDERADLIYLDPPFNSNANYNVLFKAPSSEQSAAQIEALEDTWHWNEAAERAFDEVVTGGEGLRPPHGCCRSPAPDVFTERGGDDDRTRPSRSIAG